MFNVNPRKNIIINPNFDIWQRGISFVSPGSSSYLTDRFVYTNASTATHTVTQSTTVPTFAQSGLYSKYSLKFNLTGADNSIGATDNVNIQTVIEGFDFEGIAQRQITLSFWVYATLTGTYCVSITNTGGDRSFVREYTVNTTNTWERKVLTFDASPSAGTWDYINGIGLKVRWALAAGSTFQGSAGSWQSANYTATSNQVNGVATGATDFILSQVQLELGDVATDFEFRHIQEEIEMCQRYYEKSYFLTTTPGTATDVNQSTHFLPSALTSRKEETKIAFKVEKRASPTMVIYSPITGASGNFNHWNVSVDADVAASVEYVGTKQFATYGTLTAANGSVMEIQWTASSEL